MEYRQKQIESKFDAEWGLDAISLYVDKSPLSRP